MAVLIATGVLAAYLASVDLTLIGEPVAFDEAAAMLVTFVLFGHGMEMKSRRGTSDALRALFDLVPPAARVIRNGAEVMVPTSEVIAGDQLRLRPGDKIPVARIRVLVAQQEDGQVARTASNGKRLALRREITQIPLRHRSGVAASLEGERPELAAALRRPVHAMSGALFLSAAQSIAATIQEHHDLLCSHGMAEEIPQELNALVAEYQQAESDANAGRRAHTGARTELRELSRELTRLIRQLDGVVVFHFRDKPEVLGAWKSARNVAWPVAEPVKPVRPSGPAPVVKEGRPS